MIASKLQHTLRRSDVDNVVSQLSTPTPTQADRHTWKIYKNFALRFIFYGAVCKQLRLFGHQNVMSLSSFYYATLPRFEQAMQTFLVVL